MSDSRWLYKHRETLVFFLIHFYIQVEGIRISADAQVSVPF